MCQFFLRRRHFFFREIHVIKDINRNQMYMGMRNFQSNYSNTNSIARKCILYFFATDLEKTIISPSKASSKSKI